jgi:hypothetical protein
MGRITPLHATVLDGGEVNTKPPHDIGLTEAASAVNLDPREYRGAKTRLGRETFGPTNGSGTGTKGLKAWTRNAGTSYVLYRTGTTFWHASTAAVSSISIGGTSGAYMNAAALDNYLAFVCDNLTPSKWDGTSVTSIGGSPPSEAKYAAVYSSKMFFAGDDTNPQTITFSATNNIDNYTAANDAGSITSQEGGGDTIQGLRACRKWLCIFYRFYTEILFGNSVFNFSIERLVDKGLVSPTGHAGVSDVCFFASDDAVYMVAGAKASDITTIKIREWYRNISDKTKITLSVKGDLLLVTDYGTGQSYACDYKTLRWSCWTDQYWEATDTANDQTLYAGPSASTQQIWKLDTGTADGASVISAYWRTGDIGFGWPDAIKNQAEFRVLALPGMPTTTLTYYKNGTALASTKDLTFAASGTADWAKAGPQRNLRGQYLSYKIAWSGSGTVYGFAVYAEVTSDSGEVPNEV